VLLSPNLSNLLVEAVQKWVEGIVDEKVRNGTASASQPSAPAWSGAYGGPDGAQKAVTLDPKQYTDGTGQHFDYSKFVARENPYGAESMEPTGEIDVVGPASRNNVGNPLRKGLGQFTPFEVDECQHWTFATTTYRVTKAIRIPYRYKNPRGDGEVEAHVLIGFQGPNY